MKSMTYVLAAILGGLTVSASVQANSADDKFYAGLTLGPTYPVYASGSDLKDVSASKTTYNMGFVVGKGFGSWGLELNMMRINGFRQRITYVYPISNRSMICDELYSDIMFGIDAYYNFLRNGNFTCKVIAGAELIKSRFKATIDDSSGLYTKRFAGNDAKFAPKLGVGAQYAISEALAVTSSINYVKPINHAYLTNIFYANVGMNVYF